MPLYPMPRALHVVAGLAVMLTGQSSIAVALPQPLAIEQDSGSATDRLLVEIAAIAGRQTVDNPDNPSQGTLTRDQTEIALSQLYTRKIVKDLHAIRLECSRYDEVYRIDCLRQGIDMIVASMPDRGEYDDARQVLREASRKLSRIVSANADRKAPKLKAAPGANPRFRKSRSYTAIKRESVSKAMNQASKVIEEAATQLLRSTENAERRYAHYQEISVAVGSTKTLLRSL